MSTNTNFSSGAASDNFHYQELLAMDLVDSFLKTVSSAQTHRAYSSDLRQFFQADDVVEAQVSSVAGEDVQSFVRRLHRKNASVATQRRGLAALRSFFDWLIEEDLASHNPGRHPMVKPIQSGKDESSTSPLPKSDVESLVTTAADSPRAGPRDRAIILAIVYGALRRSEVAQIEVGDVRPLGQYWILDLQPANEGGSYVRIPEVLLEGIEQVKDVYDITSGPLWRSLSPRNRGQPMTPDAVYKVVRRTSRKAGVGPVDIDTLRRSGLHIALQGGADLPQVQAHGRLRDSVSAARLHDAEDHPGRLAESAVEYIDLDISG